MVHQKDMPVIITKNGEGDMVVMSYDYFKRLQIRFDLYEKLSVAEVEEAAGAATYDLGEVIKEIKKSFSV
jgi:prevent-host-death family protein